MAQQTAVEWLILQIKNDHIDKALTGLEWMKIFEQAKQIERERRKEDIKIGYNQGYLDAQCNHVKDADTLAAELEYLQSRIDNIDALIKEKENNIADLLINNFPESK